MAVVETHPLEPFIPEGAHILILGSFPPPRSKWSMEFFYPNFINDMWRIMGLVFYGERDKFIVSGKKQFDKDAIEKFCTSKGIALYDTVQQAVRLMDNASDRFLEAAEASDIEALLRRMPECKAVAATGQKALDILRGAFRLEEPAVGTWNEFVFEGRTMKIYRMPSSSRAYPKSLEEKAVNYRYMFKDLGLL